MLLSLAAATISLQMLPHPIRDLLLWFQKGSLQQLLPFFYYNHKPIGSSIPVLTGKCLRLELGNMDEQDFTLEISAIQLHLQE